MKKPKLTYTSVELIEGFFVTIYTTNECIIDQKICITLEEVKSFLAEYGVIE